MANLIEKELKGFDCPEKVMIFFSAHGVPLAYVEEAGDPHKAEMEECVDLIIEELEKRLIINAYTLSYQGLVANNEKKTEENNLQVLKGFLISTPVKTPITFAVLRGILRAIKDHLKENSFFFPHCFLETGAIDKGGGEGPKRACSRSRRGGGKGELTMEMEMGSQQLPSLVKWINVVLPNFNLPLDTSEDELRARLRDGSVLCNILESLVPGSVKGSGSLNELIGVKRFLVVLDELGLSGFELSNLEQV
ncbi:ferrochelatase [Vigna unguiculata]|uniref:Ferrochelatase n=1 Tax=Vigna unguiculata TaxID=3917 RepID=A0A4D6LG62_VIGUN|nr:ferrochelatase [Vigna unguiculata]